MAFLTDKQLQCIGLLSSGNSVIAIARQLDISPDVINKWIDSDQAFVNELSARPGGTALLLSFGKTVNRTTQQPAPPKPAPKPSTKHCTQCGAKLNSGAKFCENCGKSVNEADSVAQKPQKEEANTQQTALPKRSTSSQLGNHLSVQARQANLEKQLIEDYLQDLYRLREQSEWDLLQHKLAFYEKNLATYKLKFPKDADLARYESEIYFLWAVVKYGAPSSALRMAEHTDSMVIALLAGARELYKEGAASREAIKLLEQSLKLWDSAKVRLYKASLHNELNEKALALNEVNYVLKHFADDSEMYLKARRLQDSIEHKSDSSCFIATSAYGSSTAREVILLRDFRDTVLMHFRLGERFVFYYYRFSPSIANVLDHTSVLRVMVKILFLAPIVWFISVLYKITHQELAK